MQFISLFRLPFLKLAWFKQIIRSLIIPSFPHSVFAARIPSRRMQTWSTTVLTPLSYDTEPAVLITFDGAKYIFNVGENTNRAFCQSQQNFKRTRGVFLTQVDSQRAGGLGGMLMACADGAINKISVVGPSGLCHYIASMRRYLYRNSMALTVTECLPEQHATLPEVFYKDDNVTVYAFTISKTTPSTVHELSTADVAALGQKRKRPPEVDRPSKIAKASYSYGLTPDEIPRETIQYMFMSEESGSNLKIHPKGDGLTEPDDYHRHLPKWFFRQLPSFHFPPAFPQSSTLAYVVVGPRVRGKIDGKKLNELDVPRNELRAKLAKGETIQFEVKGPDGPEVRIVHPEECMSKSDPPTAVIILDVPSVEMISSVVQSFDTVYRPFRSSDPEDLEKHKVGVIYHLLGPGVLEDERYSDFMRGFYGTAEHIISSPDHSPNPVTFTSFSFSQYRLSQLDPEVFPVPKFNLSPKKLLADVPSLPPNVHVMTANLHVPLRPSGLLQSGNFTPNDRFHPALSGSTFQALPDTTIKAFEEAKQIVLRHPLTETQQPSNVKILPLGTGSSIPTKYRNVLSTLIQTPHGNVLLDVGEGTLGQLTRRFGVGSGGDVDDVLANLKCIFVSHKHADHQMGLAKLLRYRRLLTKSPKQPLYIVSDPTVLQCLRERHELEDIGLSQEPNENGVIQVQSEALNYKPHAGRTQRFRNKTDREPCRKYASDMCRSLALETFETVDVDHQTVAYGVYFKSQDGWSISFSGDTRPTPNIPRVANGVTLLIHEASFGDDQKEQMSLDRLESKAHSTISEAIQVGRDANAKNVLLTHFGARYPKMPPFVLVPPQESVTPSHEPVVALAFDLMEMDLDQMWKMNAYLPAIQQCFLDSSEEGDRDLHAVLEE